MEDDITYTSKANRNTTKAKVATIFGNSKKETKQSGSSIPTAFLKKVHFMEKYPQSLRDYIKKCFAQCTDDKSREIVSTKLIDTIESASGQGNLNQHNWNTRPLVTPVEKEPTPPPPPKETFNQFQNRPTQAFSSTFINQQQSQPILQQSSYGYQQAVQPPYGNYPYGQPPPSQLIPPPPPPGIVQPNYQNPNHNYQFNNENNFNQPYQQMKSNSYFQNQGQIPAQNSYPNYEYNPQNVNNFEYANNAGKFQYNNNNNNNNQYNQNFQNKPKNTIFKPNYTNFNDANPQKRQQFASFAPGQMVPKESQAQNQPSAQSSFSSQINMVPQTQTNKFIQQGSNINVNININNNGTPNFNPNMADINVKGKKKKKNKKNKFNQQQNQQVQSFMSNNNNFDSDDSTSSSQSVSISSSRQRISHLKDEDPRAIVGTSTNLEKEYLRLAGDQDLDSSMFRPLPILKKSLDFCLDKFTKNKDYEYISEQLRSIRQDLTVQHIEDPFNVTVYETHAKLAIENGDWSNFNQSISSLEQLYSMQLGSFDHICEFYMYRIIYLFGVDDIDGLCSFIPRISQDVLMNKKVQFAIKMWKIAQAGEWMKFFAIMKKSDPLVAGVMSLKAQSLRIIALSCACRSFRNFSLQDYRTFLGFDESEDDALRKFLVEYDVQVPEK